MRTLTITVRPTEVEIVRRHEGKVYLDKALRIVNEYHWEQVLRQNWEGLHHFDHEGHPVFEFTLDGIGATHPVLQGWHVIGRFVNGERHKFARVFSDAEYDALFVRRGYLPRNWAGFHGGTADIVRVVQMPIIKRQVKSPVERELNADPKQALQRFDKRG